MEDIRQVQDEKFADEVEKLVSYAEEVRLNKSRQLSSRSGIAFGTNLVVVTGASSYFLWLLLMEGDLRLAFISLALVIFIPILLAMWTSQPKKEYKNEFKNTLMPRMAKLLGNLKYHPTGGISLKAVGACRFIPPHSTYRAEDAFMGKYKGTKIMISEARLFAKNNRPVFKGVFVLLLTEKDKFKGHTIITSDEGMIKRWRNSRWKNFSEVSCRPGVKSGVYRVFSDNQEEAVTLADEDFMELMHTLSELFEDAQITASFFKGNRVFLMIPYEDDMFEPGDIYLPITNRTHALKCKREIEQILHVVDVLDVYEADSALPQQQSPDEPEQPYPDAGSAKEPVPQEAAPMQPVQEDELPPVPKETQPPAPARPAAPPVKEEDTAPPVPNPEEKPSGDNDTSSTL